MISDPSEEIGAAARKSCTHLIVLGSHGYGAIGRAVLRGISHGVLAIADRPVLVVRGAPRQRH